MTGAEKGGAGALVGAAMVLSGGWESFAILGSVGGMVGHLIWCERNPDFARDFSRQQHAVKVVRNSIVSAFVGVMVFLGALQFGINKEPAAYFVAGVFGLFSIESAVFLLERAKFAVGAFFGQVPGAGAGKVGSGSGADRVAP